MVDETQIAEDFLSFANALVRKLRPRQHDWNQQDVEDASQLLFLAGWQDYKDNGDVGLAKNRMKDRRKNLLRDREVRLAREPTLRLRSLGHLFFDAVDSFKSDSRSISEICFCCFLR